MPLSLTGSYSPSQLREGMPGQAILQLTKSAYDANVQRTQFVVSIPRGITINSVAMQVVGGALPTLISAQSTSLPVTNMSGSNYQVRLTYSGSPRTVSAGVTWKLTVNYSGVTSEFGEKTLYAAAQDFYQSNVLETSNLYTWSFLTTGTNGNITAPPSPTAVSLEAVGATSLRARATIPIEANSAVLSLRNSVGVQITSYTWGGNGTISHDFIGLTASTAYSLLVYASNEVGNSGNVTTANVTTLTAPSTPAAVTNTAAVAISHTQIQLTWDAAPQQTSGNTIYPNIYAVKYATSSGGTFTTLATILGTSYVVGTLTANTTYYFKITSSNPSGDGGTTAEFSATTLRSPNVPRDFTSFSAAVSDYTTITLTMVYPGGQFANTFKILRSTASTGPFTQIASIAGSTNGAAVTRTYADVGLAVSTTYYYQAYAENGAGTSLTSSTNATTDATPATPGIPTSVTATGIDDSSVLITWVGVAPLTELYFDIYRATSSGGAFSDIGTASAGSTSFVDTQLNASATYYYKLKAHGYSADSGFSSEVSATTFRRSATLLPQCPIYPTAGKYGRPRQIGGRLIFPSDSNRWIVHCQGNWYYAGLKRQLTPPVLSVKAATASALAAGTYRAYTVLFDSVRNVRSLPSDASNSLTITAGQAILVAPQVTSNSVTVRDTAYGPDGTATSAATFWEYYLANENSDNAYLIERLPLAASVWEDASNANKRLLPVTLTTPTIFDGTRRPMELKGENSLPPVCAHLAVKQNRLVAFGDKSVTLTATNIAAGASLSVTRGNRYVTFSNYVPTDALIYKQLFLGGEPTGWEVWDVDTAASPDRAYIRHPDPEIDAAGFEGAGGTFTDFAFAANQSRVYLSAFYSGEALGFPTFNPEGFPPLTTYEAEFAPEDNTDPNGVIEVGNAMIVGKPGKFFYVEGGDEIDNGVDSFPTLSVTVISRGSGLNNPRTFARNRNDIAYFVGDSGLHRVRRSVVEKVTDVTNCNHMFRKVFDIASVPQSVGEWFSREDYYVCAGLNRIGNAGNKDGFIYDEKNNAMFWFSCDRQLTCLREVKNASGEFQLMCGDHFGNVGIFLRRGITHDGVDFSQAIATANSTPISFYAQTGLIDSGHAITWLQFQPRLQVTPSGSDFSISIAIDEKNRMDDPNTFVADHRIFINPDTTDDHYRVGGNRSHQSIVRFEGTTPANDPRAKLEIVEIPAKVMPRGASA
jgi:hypothetical protein